ncbi:MAG: hypothetical protein B6230_06980 [Desulfobacteraceae bacterium 4572_89]|nr:MAG: hypothetical protein B6230_06980 [Desulfobacteraceae bacterium 4572_89]
MTTGSTRVVPGTKFFISGWPERLVRSSPLWSRSLCSQDTKGGEDVRIGDYLEAAGRFIALDGYAALLRGVAFETDRRVSISQVERVDLFLEKHGAFYHPVRVVAHFWEGEPPVTLALNGAVTEPGLALSGRESGLLEQLHQKMAAQSIPRMFGQGQISSAGKKMAFFLAQWFDGYREFHLTGDGDRMVIWDGKGGEIFPDAPDYYVIYGKAVEILTRLYDPVSFAQVHPWHHAAGDFVVRPGDLDVKLVTVRGYAPLFAPDTNDASPELEDVCQGLVLFFLNISLRMRLDRIDGTGEYHMVKTDVMDHLVEGFFNGLAHRMLPSHPRADLLGEIAKSILEWSSGDVAEALGFMLDSCSSAALEIFCLRNAVAEHAHAFLKSVEKVVKKSFFIDKVS